MKTDLREWDWIKEHSRAVAARECDLIVKQIQQAVSVGGVDLQLTDKRLTQAPTDPLSSLPNLSDYMFQLPAQLRDSAHDEAADDVFYRAMDYTIPTTECLWNKYNAMCRLQAREPPVLSIEDNRRLHHVIEGVGRWLRRD